MDNRNYTKEDIKEMVDLVNNYIDEYDNCGHHGCKTCSSLEDCYQLARQKEDSEWAELINYGGYDTEEEFWEQLLG